MRLRRLSDILSAAGFGAGKWLVAFGLVLVLGLPIARVAASWVLRGDVAPSPLETPTAREGELIVTGGTATDSRKIREAISELSLTFDPTGIRVSVVDDFEGCSQCAGAYLPELREVLVPTSTVAAGGGVLRWALAHELGHYVDHQYLKDSHRKRFMALRDIPPDLTWLAQNEPWSSRPAEDFAEVFAVLVQPSVERPIATEYGRVLDKTGIEELLRDAGLSDDRPPASAWERILGDQSRFLSETLTDPLRLAVVRIIALLMAVLGAWSGALDRAGGGHWV